MADMAETIARLRLAKEKRAKGKASSESPRPPSPPEDLDAELGFGFPEDDADFPDLSFATRSLPHNFRAKEDDEKRATLKKVDLDFMRPFYYFCSTTILSAMA